MKEHETCRVGMSGGMGEGCEGSGWYGEISYNTCCWQSFTHRKLIHHANVWLGGGCMVGLVNEVCYGIC